MKRLWETICFVAISGAWFMLLGCCTVGVTCARHGDVGPWPEADYIGFYPPIIMTIVFFFWTRKGTNNV